MGGAPKLAPNEETTELEACLQELYKENICQESEEKTLPAAHRAAAAPAARAQEKHPHAPHGPQKQTENDSTTNRNVRVTLTRFKDGFERETRKSVSTSI